MFGKFLQQKITPAKAAQYGFRPGDPTMKPMAPIDAQHGVHPGRADARARRCRAGGARRIKRSWREDRKPANVSSSSTPRAR